MTTPELRLLILIVAYNAEDTLCAVLDRIPQQVMEDYDCHVLVIDDFSTDTTFERGIEYRQSRPDLPLTVLRTPSNQGYGGNQKLGYRFAITEGYDLVALVHGDGQYAPEELPKLLRPIAEGSADAVFGSRMMIPGAARRGGMPLYKYVGNKILTRTQNALSGSRLSEWHSGFRIYRVNTLAQVRFTANSDDFSFDTQIILQLLSAQARITELPIPTYYGDEICRVNGLKYASQVVRASLSHAAHRTGLNRRRALMPVTAGNSQYEDLKLGYPSSHSAALARVSPGDHVLDLGAGPGALATAMADAGARVSTADMHPPTIHDPRVLAQTVNLNEGLSLDLDPYDQILMLDVIEHLSDPERFMDDLQRGLRTRPRQVLITTPNIAFIMTRIMLLFGQFNYSETGILDRTHTRLFTFGSLRSLVEDGGFSIEEVRGIPAPFPKALGHGRLSSLLLRVNCGLIRILPRLFSYQILLVARSRPHLDQVLASTRASDGSRAA